jgi:hypothetical protein
MKIKPWCVLYKFFQHETTYLKVLIQMFQQKVPIILVESNDYHHILASSLKLRSNISFQFFQIAFSSFINSSILGPSYFPVKYILL